MGWLSNLFSGGAGGVIDAVRGAVDDLHLSGEEKQEFKLRMEGMLQQREATLQESIQSELSAKERVLVAELNQSDNFTKRARPSVVYFGLAAIALNYVIGPWITYLLGKPVPSIDLPVEFWTAWGGIVATWSIGRSFEKSGKPNRVASPTNPVSSILS